MKLIHVQRISGVSVDEDGAEVEHVTPTIINAFAIRAFYARRGGKPGTRFTFTDGGGFAVKNTPEEVMLLLGEQDISGAVLGITDQRAN